MLYGTTTAGGRHGFGTVFALTPAGGKWTETVLHSFAGNVDAATPYGGLVIGASGVLYGTTYAGGTAGKGTVFQLTPPASAGSKWNESVLHSFTAGGDGSHPEAALIMGAGGMLLGTTSAGGTKNFGTVFQMIPPPGAGGTWTESVLYSFQDGDSDGSTPYGPLVMGKNGTLYGTTYLSGLGLNGTVFALHPPGPSGTWQETVLYSFANQFGDASRPLGGVAIDSAGALYGTTELGGSSGQGAVFKLAQTGPHGQWTEIILYSFTGGVDGALPWAGLLLAPSGTLYGTTWSGGAANYGTVFKLIP